MDRRQSSRPAVDAKLNRDIDRTKEIFAAFLDNNSPTNKRTPERAKDSEVRKAVFAALSSVGCANAHQIGVKSP